MKQGLRLFLAGVMVVTALTVTAVQAQTVPGSKIYELRIYTAGAGRLGDLQALVGSKGVQLFAKHGIENVFDGTVLEGAPIDGTDASNMLVLILAHKDRAAADKDWAAVDADGAWKSAWAAAEKSGTLLSKPVSSLYLNTTAELSPSSVALSAPGSPTRVFELRKYNTGPDRLPNMVAEFKEGIAAILVKTGMTPVIYWTADDKSSFVYLLAHKDREAARSSWAAFMPEFRPFMAEFNAAHNPPPANGAPAPPPARRTPDDNRFLIPTAYSPLK